MANGFNRGWIVVLAGLCINLMFGRLYTWSIFSANLSATYKWTSFQTSLPYTVAIAMFAAIMLVGGKLQDRFGPRVVATAGGAFIGLGLVLCSVFPTLEGVILCFGVMTGAGLDMGYSAATPAAVKWFKPEQKGLIAGIVVTGFDLAYLYIAPLTKTLIASYGTFATFKILGVALVAMISISNALGRPVSGFVSDKIGRGRTMAILYLLQGATLLMFSNFHSFGTILAGSMVTTFSYGAMLAVYPSTIADFYGTRNMGFNYAILFTAWGVAGVCGPLAAGYILDATGGYGTAYLISSVLCFFAAGLGLIVKPPRTALSADAVTARA